MDIELKIINIVMVVLTLIFVGIGFLLSLASYEFFTDSSGMNTRYCERTYGDAFETRFKPLVGCQAKYQGKWVNPELIRLIDNEELKK